MRLRPAALVFHWERDASPEFNNVGDAVQAVSVRSHRHSAQNAGCSVPVGMTSIDLLVKDASFCRVLVLQPEPFDVNQGPLPRAEQPVLEGRNRQGEEFRPAP